MNAAACAAPSLNLLDRHIFKSVLFTCAAAVALFAFVVALPNIIRDLVGPLLAGQLTLTVFVRLVVLIFPFAISFALPMGILTGVLLTLGRLSADSEITAMRAAGIGVARIARPVFILGGLCGALALYINFESMPWARAQYHRELAAAVRANPLSFIVPNTFIRDFPGYVVYVVDRQGSVLQDIWLWKLDGQGRVTALERSATGRVDYDEEANSLLLRLTPAQVETRDRANPEDFTRAPVVNLFGQLRPDPIPLEQFFGRSSVRLKQEWLTFSELRAEQARLAARPPSPPAEAKARAKEEMRVALILHDKFNLSLAVLTFALVGVPLGIKVSRRETSANLGLALLLVLGYYLLTVMVKWLDRHPEYRPDVLMWVPNLLFIGLAIWLFRRIDRS